MCVSVISALKPISTLYMRADSPTPHFFRAFHILESGMLLTALVHTLFTSSCTRSKQDQRTPSTCSCKHAYVPTHVRCAISLIDCHHVFKRRVSSHLRADRCVLAATATPELCLQARTRARVRLRVWVCARAACELAKELQCSYLAVRPH